MRVLGYIFLSLLISLGVIVGDYFLPGTFLTKFLDSGFIETFAALVGFNIAAVIFLVGQLIDLEKKFAEGVAFDKTRREIKHNSYFLLIAFLLDLVLLIVRPDLKMDISFLVNTEYYVINVFILSLFCLAVSSIFEILNGVFLLGRTKKS